MALLQDGSNIELRQVRGVGPHILIGAEFPILYYCPHLLGSIILSDSSERAFDGYECWTFGFGSRSLNSAIVVYDGRQ